MRIRSLALAATLGAVLAAPRAVKAEDLNLNEKPDTVKVASLAPFSLGLGAGVMSALNDELSQRSPAFMKLSVISSFQFTEFLAMGLDADWLLPGQSWGAEGSLDYLMAAGPIRPFLGVGGGFRYMDKYGSSFGDDLGVAGTVHVGMLMDIMDEVQVRVRVPFTVVANKAGDRMIGLDVGVLFSSPLRTTKVKKLKY